MTVGAWRKLNQEAKIQKSYIAFNSYWLGVRDAIHLFIDEKDKDMALALMNMLLLKTNVTAEQFSKKVDELIKDAKDEENIANYLYKTNSFYVSSAAEKLAVPEKKAPNGPKIRL
jgi:hypothetical protein